MIENTSGGGATFGFGNKPNTASVEQKDNASLPVEEVRNQIDSDDESAETEDSLNKPYTDVSSVSIALVKNYSLYRRANDKVLPKKTDYIGGSVTSSRTLSSNKGEIEAYFPVIVGLSPNNDEFVTRIKQYLNNIRIPVDELDKTFNTSFVYKQKRDYYDYRRKAQAIEDRYLQVNRQNLEDVKAGLKQKIDDLNNLEGTKYLVGYPVNTEEYLMYRHCLLYSDVAKDLILINSDSSIRFYFKDDKREQEKARKFRLQINKAKTNYVATLADDTLFEAVYTQYLVSNNYPVIAGLREDVLEKERKLDKFSTDEPVKFNNIFSNKDSKLIGNIELLIARNLLSRSQFNQNITTDDGTFIGANMTEAVAWFKSPDNASVVNTYINKLKNI